MKVYAKTRKSHYWNEDRFIVGKDYCVVIDGATPLKKSNLFNEACWMVKYIKKNFHRYNGDIKYRLTRLCKDAYRDLPLLQKDDDYLPSASACWIELTGGKIKVGILGDCEVTAIFNDGKILRCYDGRLNVLDKKAISEMTALAKEKNIHVTEARKYIQETLIRHRKLANTPEGYPALLLSRDIQINEKQYELDINCLKTVYLYSDGFSQAFENLQIYTAHKEMFEQIESVDDEIGKIVNRSFDDAQCDMYPRFKKIDDITIIKVDF